MAGSHRRAAAGAFGDPEAPRQDRLAGDITNCGDEKEYRLLDRLLRRYVRAEAILPALGNHDAWHHSDHPNYEIAYRLFRDLCVRCGHRGDENYYEYADRCCIYLILGTERTMHNGTYLSNAQLDWLETRLRLAVRRDRVTVVVNHQATAGRNGGEASWEEEGQLAVSDRLEKLLTEAAAEAKHPVFFVSGHKHMLSPACVEKAEGKLTFVNLPSLEYGGGDEHAGTAALLQFRPEDDAPYLSFYDFIRGEPVPDTELSR